MKWQGEGTEEQSSAAQSRAEAKRDDMLSHSWRAAVCGRCSVCAIDSDMTVWRRAADECTRSCVLENRLRRAARRAGKADMQISKSI